MDSSGTFSLRGRTILVTGAAGHLGRVLCEHLLSDGAQVVAVDRDKEGLDGLVAKLEANEDSLITFASDLADQGQRAELVDQVFAEIDSLDGAVFAAAFVGTSDLPGWAVDFPEQSVTIWREVLELNLTAPFHLSQLLAPLLLRGTNPSIVNIGSIYGVIGPDWGLYEGLTLSNPAAYSVSKGGLIQLTRWLAATLAPRITVNMVSPGGIWRAQHPDFVRRYSEKTPLARMATEEDILGQVLLLLSGAASYTTGQNIVIDGGLTVV